MTTPYRTSASNEKYEPKKYGLIKRTGTNPWKVALTVLLDALRFIVRYKQPHRCNLPGELFHFWNWIKGSPFSEGSLFKCECGKLYCLYSFGWSSDNSYGNTLKKWIDAGGEE